MPTVSGDALLDLTNGEGRMNRRLSALSFDALETALVAGFACLCVWAYVSMDRIPLELEPLRARYGSDRYSENGEEWIIRDFFKDRRDGFFVDVGANHYKNFSNTYYLESRLGWSGIAVEPQREFEEDYRKFRPRTRFFAFFAADKSGENASIYVLDRQRLVASGTRDFAEKWGKDSREVVVPAITLDDLLAQLRVERIDLLSIDVELSEPKVLAGFDVGVYRPSLVCIEAHPETRQGILDFFAERGYVVVGKYLRADTRNLYFKPLH